MEQKIATIDSWEYDYIGTAHQCLYQVMTSYCRDNSKRTYGRFLSVVQSSGTGKSRMIDELSKEHIVIPINLRGPRSTGFPPGDMNVSEYILGPSSEGQTQIRYQSFLTALFEVTATYLKEIDEHLSTVASEEECQAMPFAEKLRLLMTTGETYHTPGSLRQEFYTEVIERADELASMTGNTNARGIVMKGAAENLIHFLEPEFTGWSTEKRTKCAPKLVLSFDEAHILVENRNDANLTLSDANAWVEYDVLRRTLHAVRYLPIFSLFLSTSSKICNFIPAPPQGRVTALMPDNLSLLPPFTELGFEQLIASSPLEEYSVTISNVTTDKFMSKFGRPLFGTRFECGNTNVRNEIILFAASKLIGGRTFNGGKGEVRNLSQDAKLACMAVRLALQFNPTTMSSHTRELLQVEKHMRICIVATEGFETAITVPASEPLLAKGARRIMSNRKEFDLPRTLLEELEYPGLDKGSRGELICLVLLTLASDLANARAEQQNPYSLLSFLEQLLPKDAYEAICKSTPSRCRTEEDGKRTFKEAFKNAKMHFNHFVKVHESLVINRKYLWKYIARGAAILCPTNQDDVGIVLPFTHDDPLLGRKNVSAILIQVTNDQLYSRTPPEWLFENMNPYALNVFNADDGDDAPPIIRMVFTLSSQKSAVETVQKLEENPYQTHAYTAYDIWCAGVTAKTFAVIYEWEEDVYQKLLRACKVFSNVYDGSNKTASMLRRMMNPGTSVDQDHWTAADSTPGEASHPPVAKHSDSDA
ncbi:hypothetical protein AX17_003092 [Amanita inopinata Kibby_2008]|nr:hypothetical protein AX17_003092 [Amanita inopinata Kibby_2008]